MSHEIQREKLEQAVGILGEQDVDVWLTFARETSETPDPAFNLIVGHDVTWQSAFIVTRQGRRIAIVGGPDGGLVRAAGLYDDVRIYNEGIAPLLRAVMRDLNPRQIAINYALGDVASDGLTHGMYLQLTDALKRTPYRQRLISAGPVIGALRSRKTPTERRRMQRAIEIAEEIFATVGAYIKPGVREIDVANLAHDEVRKRGLTTSWEWDSCPIVNTGGGSDVGHGGPTERMIEPGDLVHLDFGVVYDGYCSDLQRMWYVPSKTDPEPPASVQKAFAACVSAIESARKQLHAGVVGWEIDTVARKTLTTAGYPEYMHALGHSVGLACHDGGPLLGPRWPRYGETTERAIEPDSIYTLELGVATDRGYIGLEDEVHVTAKGATFISAAQKQLMIAGQ